MSMIETMSYDYEDYDATHFLTIIQYRIVGSVIFTYVMASMILHLPVMWIFITRKEFYKKPAFILMFHLAIGDLFVILDWSFACFMMFLPLKFTPHASNFGWIISIIDDCSFIPPNLFILALAVDRFFIWTDFIVLTKKQEKILCYLMIVIVYAIYTVFAILIAFDFKPYPGPANIDESIFDLSGRDGINDAPQTFLAAALFYTSIIPLFLAILLYIGVLAKFILRRLSMEGNVINIDEWLLLMQTMVPCVLKLSLQSFWNYIYFRSQMFLCIQLVVVCLDCGYDPIVYLYFNKRLRNEVKSILGLKHNQISTGGAL